MSGTPKIHGREYSGFSGLVAVGLKEAFFDFIFLSSDI